MSQNKSSFEHISNEDLSEYRSQGDHYLHKKSGCQIYHVSNDDPENLFCFSFRTPPESSNGVAHIIEHTVLCGSEKFDIKDPFITLYRGSMNTYLNAGTGSDDTIYPAASVVEKDFYNLMMIYGDAVFFPLLKKEAFSQEGHHLEFDEEGQLNRVGIVYNEMKGDYSSFDSVVSECSYTSLYTEGPLQFDAGGDPANIPELTYEQFVDFHKTYYHPSNCRIFLYGNLPIEKTLKFIDENFLSRFDARETQMSFPLQKSWTEPKTFVVPAPAGEEGSGSTHSINWLLEPVGKVKELTALRILSSLLLGTSASPLQAAIEKYSSGDDLSPVSGLDIALYETLFSVGIRGAKKDEFDKFKDLVFDTLQEIVEKGFSKELIEGTFRRQEFREREIRGGIPFGYRLMYKSFRGWLHGLGPTDTLHFEKWINLIREEAKEEGYFEGMIQKYLLDNSHRSHVTVYPDGDLLSRKEKEVQAELKQIQRGLTPDQVAQLEKDNKELRIFQEKVDDPNVIPCLHRDDIPKTIITIPSQKETRNKITLYTHDFFTNGVLYLDLLFPIKGLSEEELLWLPFFSQTFFELGTDKMDYQEAARQISLKLGGMSASLEGNSALGTDNYKAYLNIRVKMLEGQMDEGLTLLESFLHGVDFTDSRRLKELMAELKNDYRSSFIPSGSSYAVSHTVRGFSPSTAMEEMWYGLEQYYHLNDFDNSLEETSQLGGIFRSLKKKILQGEECLINITTDSGKEGNLVQRSLDLVARLGGQAQKGGFVLPKVKGPFQEAYQISADVAYIGASLPGALLGTKEYNAQLVLSHLLKSGYFWEEIRMKGGAYGASASLSGLDSYFSFSSYRDPQVLKTIEVFKKGLQVYPKTITQDDLERALIGVIGKDLKPMAPLEKGILAMRRDLYNISDQIRQDKRDGLLTLQVSDLTRVADQLLSQWDQLTLTVISGETLLDRAAGSRKELKDNRKTLL